MKHYEVVILVIFTEYKISFYKMIIIKFENILISSHFSLNIRNKLFIKLNLHCL